MISALFAYVTFSFFAAIVANVAHAVTAIRIR